MSNILKYQNPSSPLLIQKVNQSGVNFVKRLLDPDRKSIPDWETKGQKIATHKMSWGEDDQGAYVFPEVQEIDDQLIDFSRPPYAPGIADYMAHKNNNIIRMSPEEADWFTRNYKQYYPSFKKGGRIHIKKKNRGKFTEYCGGKVTQECIAKGKKSKDPKIRKRATFAANARKWKHENGGVIGQFNIGGIVKAQDSAKLVSGYTTHDDDNLRNVETFNKNWLLQRDSQLAKQGLLDPEIKNNLNWWNRNMHVSNKKVADIIRNRLFSNLDETKEFSTTSALKDRKGYQVLKNKLYADYPIFEWDGYDLIGPPKPLDPEILRHVFETSSAGIYSPEYRTIVYNEDFINTPTKIHERDHAMFAPINSEFSGVNAIDKETYRFKDWEVPERWGYYEDPLEVRARLMQMRFDNKLDPKHEYSDEEIESMRNDPNFKDYKIFERYNNEYIKFLLNDVAQNNMNENRFDYRSPINFAKNGGILKAQGGTGNNFWSKLWNAVKAGGMAARDAKLGSVGAQQVRDLYSEGKNQEAQDLAKQYAKANTTGIALAGGAASTGLLGDLLVTGATTAADTFIDGDTENFGKNLVKNTAGDLIGHGVFKGLRYFNGKPIFVKEMKNGIGDGLYHLDYGDTKGAFKSGSYIKNGYLYPGKTDLDGQLDYIWFNEFKPYATAVRGKPFSRTIIFDQKDIPGILRVREQNYPIGQWNGKSGFVTKHEMVTSNPIDMDNATVYKRIPIFNTWLRTK